MADDKTTLRQSWATSKAGIAWIGAGITTLGVIVAAAMSAFRGGDKPGVVVVPITLPATQASDHGLSPVPLVASGLTILSIKPILQPVNQKFTTGKDIIGSVFKEVGTTSETATFSFTLFNGSSAVVRITGAELIIDERRGLAGAASTGAYIPLIDHEGHIPVLITSSNIGDCIPIVLNLSVAPKAKREFTVWFRSEAGDCAILTLTGRLRLHCEGVAPVTSDAIKIEMHSERRPPEPGSSE